MSSPISNLKKGKRTPLNPRQPRAPFRYDTEYNYNHASELQDEIPSDFLRRDVLSKLPKSTHKASSAPTDHELLNSMAGRLAQAESELKTTKREIIEKDRKIKILQEKVQLLEKARGYNSDTIGDLEIKCQALQSQVHDMEEFLSDYGLLWVGNEYTPLEEELEADILSDEMRTVGGGMWNPGASVPRENFQMDFDLVIKNIKELNILSGEGCAVVSKTKDGARLKVPDAIPLTLMLNGIIMFAGPFRPYSDPTTQQCMQDIMDGYFPSELQSRYPDGVPFQVDDKRDVVYSDKRTEILFPGAGQSLTKDAEDVKVNTEIPGAKHSMDSFLSRLPQSVIKGGKIIDVRSGVEETIKGSNGLPSSVVVLNTPVLEDIKSRLEESEKHPDRPKSASSKVTTLRIKSETGEKVDETSVTTKLKTVFLKTTLTQTYILKMNISDTVADVRKHLDLVRPNEASDYQIKSSFPNKVYSNLSSTLQECGLVPNATLHLLLKKN